MFSLKSLVVSLELVQFVLANGISHLEINVQIFRFIEFTFESMRSLMYDFDVFDFLLGFGELI